MDDGCVIARILAAVHWPAATYDVMIPHAADPTRSTIITVPIKAAVRSHQEARAAAIQEIGALSDAELQVMLSTQARERDPLERGLS